MKLRGQVLAIPYSSCFRKLGGIAFSIRPAPAQSFHLLFQLRDPSVIRQVGAGGRRDRGTELVGTLSGGPASR